jgi:hypothetical protein
MDESIKGEDLSTEGVQVSEVQVIVLFLTSRREGKGERGKGKGKGEARAQTQTPHCSPCTPSAHYRL